MTVFFYALFLYLVHPAAVFANQPRNGACRDNREEFGFALVGHDYKTVHADNFGRCFFECTLEEKCQSVTYLWNSKECKMNKETKRSKSSDFEENPAATYMENRFRGLSSCYSFINLSAPINCLMGVRGGEGLKRPSIERGILTLLLLSFCFGKKSRLTKSY